MLRLIGIVVSIGLADSMNPTTIGPALLLAAGEHPREMVAKFTAGAFTAYFLGGVLIALGPGQFVLGLVPKIPHNTVQIIEVIAGVLLIAAGLALWRFRVHLASKQLPAGSSYKRTGFWLGATIMAVELPTAFPYLAAIAAIVSTHRPIPVQIGLILLFNICFILPLLGIILVLTIYGERADVVLTRVREFLGRHWPIILAVVALVLGGIVITLGLTGIIKRTHFFKHFR